MRLVLISSFSKIFLNLFLEGEGEREKHQCVAASHAPPLGTWPTTQAHALTGNRTGNPLVCRPVPHPLSHTTQGSKYLVLSYFHPLVLGAILAYSGGECDVYQVLIPYFSFTCHVY